MGGDPEYESEWREAQVVMGFSRVQWAPVDVGAFAEVRAARTFKRSEKKQSPRDRSLSRGQTRAAIVQQCGE